MALDMAKTRHAANTTSHTTEVMVMQPRKAAILTVAPLLLALSGSAFADTNFWTPIPQAANSCMYFTGPEEPVAFAPNPATGFIELSLPIQIGEQTFTVDVEAAILGFLETSPEGQPRRALQTQSWDFSWTGLRLEWNGDTRATPTDDPAVVDYTLHFDLAAAHGGGWLSRRIESGVAVASGQINLLDFTGNTVGLFGRLCSD